MCSILQPEGARVIVGSLFLRQGSYSYVRRPARSKRAECRRSLASASGEYGTVLLAGVLALAILPRFLQGSRASRHSLACLLPISHNVSQTSRFETDP